MTHDELIAEACRLAKESVENNWGGPFGAVIARDGEIVARGQNRVLLTGDITAHAEVEAIRKAARVINPYSPSISPPNQNKSTLKFVARPEGSPDPVSIQRGQIFILDTLARKRFRQRVSKDQGMLELWEKIEAVLS